MKMKQQIKTDHVVLSQQSLRELCLFAGAGGGILGGTILGWRTVCAVENAPYARDCLLARQRDGCLPRFPIWDDVCTFDGKPWKGSIDIVSGGFPCQDISAAGRGKGITGERSGLWKEMARIVGEVRPRYVFVENSPLLVKRGLAVVIGDLASMGYATRWGIVGAHHAGAPHKRDRIWIVADAHGFLCRTRSNGRAYSASKGSNCESPRSGQGVELADTISDRRQERGSKSEGIQGGSPTEFGSSQVPNTKSERCGEAGQFRHNESKERPPCGGQNVASPLCIGSASGIPEPGKWQERISKELIDGDSRWPIPGSWWESEPQLGRVANGVANRVDIHGATPEVNVERVGIRIPHRGHRLKAIGNGQVPMSAALAWVILTGEDDENTDRL